MSLEVAMRFVQFLEEIATKGEAVNLVFEERLFNLVGILQKITDPLTAANIPYEVVGGLAVLIHGEEADRTHSMLTRDVDLLIVRSDLKRVIAVAESQGFRFRHAAGVDMLLYGDKATNAIHLLFSGEKVKPSQVIPNPARVIAVAAGEASAGAGNGVAWRPWACETRMKTKIGALASGDLRSVKLGRKE